MSDQSKPIPLNNIQEKIVQYDSMIQKKIKV